MRALVAVGVVLAALTSGSGAGARPASCPRGLLPVTANSISPAAAAALAREDASARPLVVGATLATADQQRGPTAKRRCGATVWQRTIVVYIRLRAFGNSASLSSRVSFVGRFRGGYRVWQIVH